MNDISATIFYDKRLAISAPIEEPVVWKCSKVEQVSPKGISHLTFAQVPWNSHSDYIEKDEEGYVIGIWCDYWQDNIEPQDPNPIPSPSIHSLITFSGVKPEVKVNGSYKKFTVRFYDDENNENNIPILSGHWEFKVSNTDLDASDLISFEDITPTGEDMYKQIKLKFIGEDEWIDKNISIWYVSDSGIKSHVVVNVIGI